MLSVSSNELDRIKDECKAMATKRAVVSSVASMVPIPGVDIVADIGMLMEVLPKISSKFGLAADQIEQLDPQSKAVIYGVATNLGNQMIGKVLTKQLVMQVLKTVGIRLPAKQVAKYIPVAGQIAAATLGFAAMKLVCESHINDCHRVAKQLASSKR
jgi:uncharacterized protein (DUF697 family)